MHFENKVHIWVDVWAKNECVGEVFVQHDLM